MRDVCVDGDGVLRCWNCGGKDQFLAKRTGAAHITGFVTVGIGALATKKKLKCQLCGEYNQTGNAKPYMGPAGRKYRKQEQRAQKAQEAAAAAAVPPPPPPTASTPSVPPPSPPPQPAGPPEGWYPDPQGLATERWWDGRTWTNATK